MFAQLMMNIKDPPERADRMLGTKASLKQFMSLLPDYLVNLHGFGKSFGYNGIPLCEGKLRVSAQLMDDLVH